MLHQGAVNGLAALQLAASVLAAWIITKAGSPHPRRSVFQILTVCVILGTGTWQIPKLLIESRQAPLFFVITHLLVGVILSISMYRFLGVLSQFFLDNYIRLNAKHDNTSTGRIALTPLLFFAMLCVVIAALSEFGIGILSLLDSVHTSTFTATAIASFTLSFLSATFIAVSLLTVHTHSISLWRDLYIDHPPETPPVNTELMATFLSYFTFEFAAPSSCCCFLLLPPFLREKLLRCGALTSFSSFSCPIHYRCSYRTRLQATITRE